MLPVQGSEFSKKIDNLYMFIFWMSVVLFLAITIATFYFAWKYRARPGRVTEHIAHNAKLELAWTIIPLFICIGLFFWGVHDYTAYSVAPGDAMQIQVTGKKWLWAFEYPDGSRHINDIHIPVGKTFVYEFELKGSGTFMYHPHSDEMVQMAMGLMGMFVVHPKDPNFRRVDRDFVFVMSAYRFDPGTALPKVAEMLDFNIWTFNARVFPGIDVMPVRLGDRVRVRMGNLTMTAHPIHLHGHHFSVTGTDGGWVPESAQWPEATTDVPVGSIRAIDVVADAPGDWAFHCHKSHHTMNAMGHDVVNLIGVPQRTLARAVKSVSPDAMAMGSDGMGMMGEMSMPLPDNTLPMMTGTGQFGPIEMGGMFTVMKVREGLAANDYKDPGPYKNPPGTVAHEVNVAQAAEPARQPGAAEAPGTKMPGMDMPGMNHGGQQGHH